MSTYNESGTTTNAMLGTSLKFSNLCGRNRGGNTKV